MNIRFLIDTDWAIEYLRGNINVVKKLNQVRPQGLGISIISVAELQEGIIYSRDPTKSKVGYDQFLSGVHLLTLDEEICRIFGQERGRLRKEGKRVGDFDTLIAATCLRHQLILFTNNLRHFEVFSELTIETLP